MMSKKDILELKPGIYGISIDIRALWRRFFSKKEKGSLTMVAQRFIEIFENHNVSISQIPRLVPNLSLKNLSSHKSLISALTPKHLSFVAELFKIKLEWLEGTSEKIYEPIESYKKPWNFLEDLKTLKTNFREIPVVGFTSVKNIDSKSSNNQPITIVLTEECARLDKKIIYRYRIHDEFYWGYWKTRIQLKAMMRIVYLELQNPPIVLYSVKSEIYKLISEGYLVPAPYYKNSLKINGFLEDYSLLDSESKKAKDQFEIQEVLKYIEIFKLQTNVEPEWNKQMLDFM